MIGLVMQLLSLVQFIVSCFSREKPVVNYVEVHNTVYISAKDIIIPIDREWLL